MENRALRYEEIKPNKYYGVFHDSFSKNKGEKVFVEKSSGNTTLWMNYLEKKYGYVRVRELNYEDIRKYLLSEGNVFDFKIVFKHELIPDYELIGYSHKNARAMIYSIRKAEFYSWIENEGTLMECVRSVSKRFLDDIVIQLEFKQ